MTQARPAPIPMGTVNRVASHSLGIAARPTRNHGVTSRVTWNSFVRSMSFDRNPSEAMPRPMPIPRAIISTPNPVDPAWSEYRAKIGPSEITDPAPPKATVMPRVIVAMRGLPRRNRTPSLISWIAEAKLSRAPSARARAATAGRNDRPHTIRAEKRNVAASNHRARNSGWLPR